MVLILVLSCNVIFSVDSSVYNWASDLRFELLTDNLTFIDNCGVSVSPSYDEINIGVNYESWQKKRYNSKLIIENSKDIIYFVNRNRLSNLIILYNAHDEQSFNEFKYSLDDIQDYIFLENDKGEFLRCSRINLEWEDYIAGTSTFGQSVILFEPFSDDGVDIFKDSKTMTYVLSGICDEDIRITYDLPLSEYAYKDAPKKIKDLWQEIKIELNL
jgi:hypothetical protein